MSQIPRPDTKAPELIVRTTEDKKWDLASLSSGKMTLIVFYRGKHCPVCKKYLKELNSKVDKFKKFGVEEIIAISGDGEKKAKTSGKEWEIDNFKIGYEQSLDSMVDWGLFVSRSIKDTEPRFFGEPGFFLVDSDSKIFHAAVNSMPFGRPRMDDMIDALKFIQENDYPRRGTVETNIKLVV